MAICTNQACTFMYPAIWRKESASCQAVTDTFLASLRWLCPPLLFISHQRENIKEVMMNRQLWSTEEVAWSREILSKKFTQEQPRCHWEQQSLEQYHWKTNYTQALSKSKPVRYFWYPAASKGITGSWVLVLKITLAPPDYSGHAKQQIQWIKRVLIPAVHF